MNPAEFLERDGYHLGSTIGQGSYSKVKLAERDGKSFAVKIISRIRNESEYVERFLFRELEVISEISHPNIIQVFRIIDFSHHIYIFMEFAEGGDLLEYILNNEFIPENKIRKYFRDIIRAVVYLHKNNICHRDLKCENILITKGDMLKLTDFGFTRKFHYRNKNRLLSETFYGTIAYSSPELLQRIPYDPMKNDIWSIGCILYFMVTKKPPFDESDLKTMIRCQLEKRFIRPSTFNNKISLDLEMLINAILEPDVQRRVTAENITRIEWLY